MPLFDYECSKKHRFEAYAKVSDESLPCRAEGCKEKAGRIFVSCSGIGEPRDAQGFAPPLVWRNADGSFTFAGSSHESAPQGAERVDFRNWSDVRKFEREMNQRERERHDRSVSVQQEVFEARRKAERSDLFQRMKSMSPRGRAFAEMAIQMGNARRSKLYQNFDPGCHFDVFSQDRSNRNGERSERTEWRERKA